MKPYRLRLSGTFLHWFYINKVVCCGELLYFIEEPSCKAIYHDEVRDLFALVEVYGKLLIYAKNRERKERK